MRTLFIMDPIPKLKPQSDTSLYVLRELLRRKVHCASTEANQVSWEGDRLWAEVQTIESCPQKSLPKTGKSDSELLTTFDLILIRKDPPFDESYQRLCWLLAPFEKKVRMLNRPSLLLRHHEKMLPLEGLAEGFLKSDDLIPSCITSQLSEAEDFWDEQSVEEIVVKPWLGFGGSDVFLFPDRESFQKKSSEFFDGRKTWILQPFESDVQKNGDRRVFFFGGECVGSVVRIPKQGSIVSNFAQGGTAADRPMSAKEEELTDRLGKWLAHTGIEFAGADYIAGKVNEVNITSPTGFSAFEQLYQKDLSKPFVDFILKT